VRYEKTPPSAKATRATVQQAARTLGYKPNAEMTRFLTAVRAGQAGRVRETLGFLWTDARALKPHANHYSQRLFLAAKQRADELNYGLDEFFYDASVEGIRQLQRVLQARGIRGVLIAASATNASIRIELDLSLLHAVAIGRSVAFPHLDRAVNDQFGISLAMHQLSELGYRRIGQITQRVEDQSCAHRITGAYHACTTVGGLSLPLPILYFDHGLSPQALIPEA
jgi:LacI family transcriptional regulator